MKKFPSGQYGRQTLRFHPAPFRAPLRAFAGLLFAWNENRVVICDILGRGWCIPSGRVEPFETSREAVKREAMEEAGAVMRSLDYIGCYHISERQEVRWADCYAGLVCSMADHTMPEESNGARLVTLEELPGLYHSWNELTKMVFEHSFEVVCRKAS